MTNLEAVAVSIRGPIDVSICNIYIPNSQNFSVEELNHLLHQIPSPRILLGDFNSHNILWGSQKIDKRGRLMEQFIDTQSLVLMNTGEKTRFNAYSGEFSAIDLSICDPNLAAHLSWMTYDYLYGSDHLPILIEHSQLSKPKSLCYRRGWNLKNADWVQYSSRIESLLRTQQQQQQQHDTVTEMVNHFQSIILLSAMENIGKTSPPKHHNPVPWWNSECKDAIKLSKQAYNRLKRKNTFENLMNFKRLRAKARYIVKKASVNRGVNILPL